jgi:hypothetical protein
MQWSSMPRRPEIYRPVMVFIQWAEKGTKSYFELPEEQFF